MQAFSTFCLFTVAVGYFLAGGATAHKYIIPSELLIDPILSGLRLGPRYWSNELQIEGLGIAQSLIFLLQKKYPETTQSLDDLKKHKILIVGELGGNGLGGWAAAVILAAFGIHCELYVIQNEPIRNKFCYATSFSKALLEDIKTLSPPNITFVQSGDFTKDFCEEFPEQLPIKEEIMNPTDILVETVEAFMAKARDESENSNYWSFKNLDMTKYSLVLDGTSEVSSDDNEFKLGNVFALMLLKKAESVLSNILVSNNSPSLWHNGLPFLSRKYSQFGLEVLMPSAIIHIGAMKLYVLQNDSLLQTMLHYVVVPKPLEDVLEDSSSEAFKASVGDKVESGVIKEIPSSFSYKNVVVDINKETLENTKLMEVKSPIAAVAKYFGNLITV